LTVSPVAAWVWAVVGTVVVVVVDVVAGGVAAVVDVVVVVESVRVDGAVCDKPVDESAAKLSMAPSPKRLMWFIGPGLRTSIRHATLPFPFVFEQ